jgi:hypothetical protein
MGGYGGYGGYGGVWGGMGGKTCMGVPFRANTPIAIKGFRGLLTIGACHHPFETRGSGSDRDGRPPGPAPGQDVIAGTIQRYAEALKDWKMVFFLISQRNSQSKHCLEVICL